MIQQCWVNTKASTSSRLQKYFVVHTSTRYDTTVLYEGALCSKDSNEENFRHAYVLQHGRLPRDTTAEHMPEKARALTRPDQRPVYESINDR